MQQIKMFDIHKYREIQNLIEKSNKNTKIVVISKNHPLQKIEEAISQGICLFGENRVQEAKFKFENIIKKKPPVQMHLTGPLQTNKVKQALEIFDVFHTIDREKLLKELSKFTTEISKKSFFIQVNTGKELSKSGVYPEKVKDFLSLCNLYGIMNVKGLMCIPPINEDPKKHFELLKNISNDVGLNGLSIGMSSDYMQALELNPTYIRLGTLLFGKRQ